MCRHRFLCNSYTWCFSNPEKHHDKGLFCTYHSKGQIISQGLLGVLEFSQKWTNEFFVVIKTNSFLQFLGEFDDTKSPFEIIRPLVNVSTYSYNRAIGKFKKSKRHSEINWPLYYLSQLLFFRWRNGWRWFLYGWNKWQKRPSAFKFPYWCSFRLYFYGPKSTGVLCVSLFYSVH